MKRFIARVLNTLPKRVATLAVLGMAVLLPVSSIAAETVAIEGAIGVANVSKGDTRYVPEVNASYDEVVKVEVYYHNRENEDSGKIADDLRVKIDVPSTAGTTQVIRGTINGTNTNTVSKTATVRLDRTDAFIEYIPGSAVWRHNVGTNAAPQYREDKVSDAVVTSGTGIVLEDEKPCYNFAATVTILVRVKIPSVGVYKKVRLAGTQNQTVTDMNVSPGARLEYVVTAKNLSNTDLTNVYLRDPLPQGLTYVPGTAKKTFGQYVNTPMSADEANAFLTGKKNVGTLKPGAAAYIVFEATVAVDKDLKCGVNELKNIAVVDTDQTGEYHAFVIVTANKVCANVPAYSCDLLDITKGDNRTVTINQFKSPASNGATFKDAVISWGDGSTNLTTNVPVGKSHQYSKDGEYTISATARFTVNGQTKEATSAACVKKINFTTPGTPPTTPEVLPNTGAGDIIGIFVATTVAGALAHKFVWARRFGA